MNEKTVSPATRANGDHAVRSNAKHTTDPHQFARAGRRSWLFGKRRAAFPFRLLTRG